VKKVEAFIRPERLAPVLEELGKLGYPGVSMSRVVGHGKQKGVRRIWRGESYRLDFLPKVKLELVVVVEEDLDKVVWAVMKAARTGSVGDGKIFVFDVADAVRIRTGETGYNAI